MEISNTTFAAVLRAASSDIDWKEFAIRIAEQNPELFIETVYNIMNKSWIVEAKAMASVENLVSTVKFIREHTSMGLKDAKDLAEQFIREKIDEQN